MCGDLASGKVRMEQPMSVAEQGERIGVIQKVRVRSGCAEPSCVRGRQRMGRLVGTELSSHGVTCQKGRAGQSGMVGRRTWC